MLLTCPENSKSGFGRGLGWRMQGRLCKPFLQKKGMAESYWISMMEIDPINHMNGQKARKRL